MGWVPLLEAPTQPSPFLRKINFLIWDRIWPAHGYFQVIGVLGMRFWALFGVSDFYLFRQVWSLTNPWPCSNLGFPWSIFFFFAPKDPPWWVERRYAKKGGVFPRRVLIAERWFGVHSNVFAKTNALFVINIDIMRFSDIHIEFRHLPS